MKLHQIEDWSVMRGHLFEGTFPEEILTSHGDGWAAWGVTLATGESYLYVKYERERSFGVMYRLNKHTRRFQDISDSDTAKKLMESHFEVAKMESLL